MHSSFVAKHPNTNSEDRDVHGAKARDEIRVGV
jgi:hypothetical protein